MWPKCLSIVAVAVVVLLYGMLVHTAGSAAINIRTANEAVGLLERANTIGVALRLAEADRQRAGLKDMSPINALEKLVEKKYLTGSPKGYSTPNGGYDFTWGDRMVVSDPVDHKICAEVNRQEHYRRTCYKCRKYVYEFKRGCDEKALRVFHEF